MRIRFFLSVLLPVLLAACAAPSPREPLRGHLSSESAQVIAPEIPPASEALPRSPATPPVAPKAETYSVIVNNVPVHDLLFVLARDARLNIDIHPGISGTVTLNAIDQTLPQLLKRIARQIDMRIEQEGPNLSIMPDTPFLKHYAVDYVNLSRTITGMVSANSQIASGLPGASGGASGNVGTGGNISNTRIENSSKSQFWESLEKNIKDILRETDKILPPGSTETIVEQSSNQTASGIAALPRNPGKRAGQSAAGLLQANPSPSSASQASGNATVRRNTFREAASVILNVENGIIAIRATQRQHERIREFLDRVINAAHRQVLIESTIVEVTLKEGYEQGIDWTQLSGGGLVEYIGNPLKSAITLKYTRDQNPNALISLLDTFGTTKVLSSPRLSVLNNQTALLKAVENYVYFTVKADTTTTANVGTATTYTTTPQTVSVGLVMGVTPQISDNDMVILNVRPTITSVGKEIADPNPELRKNGIENLVPVIRTREVESVMRVASGNIAVLGGLMEDKIDYQTRRLPLAGQIPLAGELLNNRSNFAQKSELVIFLRPVIIREASLEGDYANFRPFLPDERFFRQPNEAQPFNIAPNH
ncbi:MAG: secretin N-terminal domain-containing protein [Azonexus sp.]